MECKFKKGDKVKVINSGGIYSNHFDMAKELNLKNWVSGNSLENDTIGKIVNISGYHVGITTQEGDFIIGKDCLKLLDKNYKPKTPSHLVVWEEDTDPCKFFNSLEEANEFIKELSKNTDVKQDSIILVEIKSARKITIQKSLRTKEFKI